MLLVFLSHFVEALYRRLPDSSSQTIRLVTRVSTPAFVWISGVTLAVLFARHQRSFAHTRDRLIDRGLFLILVAHPLSFLACVPLCGSWHAAERIVFITDTFGVAVIVGSWLISRVPPGNRLLLGIGLLMAAWGALAAWNPPVASTAWRIKDLLLGDWRDSSLTYNFPLVPWFGFSGVSLLPLWLGILKPLYFLVTVLVLWMFVSLWARLGANRLITVGYPAMVAHWNHRLAHAPSGGFGLSPPAKAATPGVYGSPPPPL